MKTVKSDFTAAQRLLVNGITASTLCLVRALQDGSSCSRLRELMAERQRMLRELQSGPVHPVLHRYLAVIGAAVEESDRTVEQLAA